jgi:hypothetical protein
VTRTRPLLLGQQLRKAFVRCREVCLPHVLDACLKTKASLLAASLVLTIVALTLALATI